jgi:hypothetical protein
VLDFPVSHVEHVAFPVFSLYLPTTHCVQMPPSDPVEPASQVHAVKAELPTGESEYVGHVVHVVAPIAAEYVPDPQSRHESAPVATLYLPTTHCVQVPPLGPDEPGLQMQAVEDELPAGESEYVGQVEHVVAPITAEYLPDPHLIHTVVPSAALYFPTEHFVHTPPSWDGPRTDHPALQMQLS